MSNYDVNLGRPAENDIIVGRYSLFRYHRDLATAAAPVASTAIYGMQDFSLGAKNYNKTFEVMQYGGGDNILEKKSDGMYTGTLDVALNRLPSLMAAILGETWSAAGNAGMPFVFPFYPLVHIEAILRGIDNETHIHSVIIQDVILEPFALPVSDDVNKVSIPFKTKFDAIMIPTACKFVLDVFNGDGSTIDFTPSDTPLTVTDSTLEGRESWDWDTALFVKTRTSTQDTGDRVQTGVTITPATPVLTFATAPASGTTVSMGYIAAIS